MRLPPTRIESFSGSARSPSFAAFPLTKTRPSRIHSSASRREAIPAWARIFWMRTPSPGGRGPGSRASSILRVPLVFLILVVLVVVLVLVLVFVVELVRVFIVEVVVASHRGGRQRLGRERRGDGGSH